jgi:UDP-glucose 4-epimerase
MLRDQRKVLVTGGCGFIGVHLCKALIENANQVIIVDNLDGGDRSRISEIEAEGRVKFYEVDICDHRALDDIFKQELPTDVVHLAAGTSVSESRVNPKKYFDILVAGTFNVLSSASRVNVKKFIYTNSAATYGKAQQLPTPESAEPRPTNPYGTFKYLGEQLSLTLGAMSSLEVVSLRLFNLYGEFGSALFGLFVNQSLKGEPLTITGDGMQRRDFTFVGDVVNAICKVLESDIKNEIINVATGETHSIIDLADALGEEYRFIPRASDEPDLIWADISKLQKLLPNAVPSSPFGETVREVMTKIKSKHH